MTKCETLQFFWLYCGKDYVLIQNKVSWRSRVALDFAFLLSYCSRLEVDEKKSCSNRISLMKIFSWKLCTQGVEIVMNLEDDVRVAENFVSKILQFRRSLEKYKACWYCTLVPAYNELIGFLFSPGKTGFHFWPQSTCLLGESTACKNIFKNLKSNHIGILL